jgi:hypothetical protein
LWLCYGYSWGVALLWVFKGCGYVMGILDMWFCYGYSEDGKYNDQNIDDT